MRIKKFRCIQCGGPKVNPYSTPYIMCDFCGAFTDIDFAIGIETWNENAGTTVGYQIKKAELMTRSREALAQGDRDGYYWLQREYWDYYYQSFPAYLPPTIDNVEKYNVYLDVCAASSVDSGFDPKWHEYSARQQQLQNALRYVQTGVGTKAETESFFTLADFFVTMMREAMRIFYENPQYAVMHELLPERVHLKMKTSMFVQAWLPYLTDEDAERLLRMLEFSNEYEEIERPDGDTVECSNCKAGIYAPRDAYRVFCEKCRHVTPVKSQFFCMSCGSANRVPEDPSKPIDCERCGIANRLIRPFFG
ncbi:MAG: hypothetical protein HOP17_06725 [Acidobacteria bacterium]|nr:hypothetical protein [Acidobacteriota bacterium]